MSKIQTIQPNFQPAAQARLKKQNSPSFSGGAAATVDELATMVARGARPVEKGARKGITNLSRFLDDGKGEIQNQLINAAFTTTFAPLFIAFNPFTEQDSKTKKYTALRQPVSAAVALLCSMPLTKGFNEWVGKLGTNGLIPGVDLRMSPEKGYLEKQFKKEYKKAGKTVKFLEDQGPKPAFDVEKFKGGNEASGKVTRRYKNAARDAYVKAKQDASKEIFTKLIGDNKNNLSLETAKGIPGFETQEALDNYLLKNNLHNKTFGQFLEDEFKFELYKGGVLDGQFKPTTLNKKLSEVKAIDFLTKMGLVEGGKIGEEELAKMISFDRQEEKLVKPLEKQFAPNAFTDKNSAKILADSISSQAARISQLNSGETEPKAKLHQLLNRFGYIDDKEKLQKLADKKMSEVIPEFAEKLKNGKLKNFVYSEDLKDYAKNIIEHKAKLLGDNIDVLKKYSGILVNVPILIVSCSILNWLYPRFVEKFFPSLVKDDKVKGGNK